MRVDEQAEAVAVVGVRERDAVLVVQQRRPLEELAAGVSRAHHVDDLVVDLPQPPPGKVLVARLAEGMESAPESCSNSTFET